MISQTAASKPGMNIQQHNPHGIQNQQRQIAAFAIQHLDIYSLITMIISWRIFEEYQTIQQRPNNPTKTVMRIWNMYNAFTC